MSSDETSQRERLLLYSLLLLAFVLRVYRLDFQSLWRDETDAVIFATQSLPTLLAKFTQIGENGPLYFLGLHGWLQAAGHSEFALRFPALVFGVLAVPTTYRLGRALLGSPAGLLAAFLLAVSPYHVWYSQDAKMYGALSFLAPLSLLLLLHAVRGAAGLRRQAWVAWAAWLLTLVVLLYIHLFSLVMALVGLVWLLLLQGVRPRRQARRQAHELRGPRPLPVLLGLAVLGLAALPVLQWLVPAALTPAETGYYRYSLGEMAGILLQSFSMGLRPAGGVWPLTLLITLLLGGCFPLFVRPPALRRGAAGRVVAAWPAAPAVLLIAVYLLLPLLAIWAVSLVRPTFTDRYLIIVLPAFYLLLATGVLVVGRLLQGLLKGVRAAWLARAAQVGLVGLLVLSLAPFLWLQSHDRLKADFRQATAYADSQARAGDLYLFLMPYARRSYAYYHPQPVPFFEPPYTAGMSPADAGAAMAAGTSGAQRVLLFASEPEFWDPAGLIAAWLEQHGTRTCRQAFTYIEVSCYELRR